jgi:hypothetical protein
MPFSLKFVINLRAVREHAFGVRLQLLRRRDYSDVTAHVWFASKRYRTDVLLPVTRDIFAFRS